MSLGRIRRRRTGLSGFDPSLRIFDRRNAAARSLGPCGFRFLARGACCLAFGFCRCRRRDALLMMVSFRFGNLPDSRLRLEGRAVSRSSRGGCSDRGPALGGDVALDESLSYGRQNLIGKVHILHRHLHVFFLEGVHKIANQFIILSIPIYSLQTS
jgi:hypothetical protein